MNRRSSAALLALALLGGLTAVPAGRHHDRHGGEGGCQEDCQRSGDGDGRQFCFMPCSIVIPAPTPTPPPSGKAGQAMALVPPAVLL